jgi:hypothetical protein
MGNERKTKRHYDFQFVYRPGRTWSDRRLQALVRELRATAATCFDELPDYQVMVGTREEMADKVIAIAWREDGRIAGFCSNVILPVPGVGKVLHLGLTCVRPEDRAAGLTHLLTRRTVAGYVLRKRPVGRVWVSNVAAVLSSLGNVALHFERIYPSPYAKEGPSPEHLRIADAIDKHYRDKMYISADARFDPRTFVFRGSVKGTVFEKEAADSRFYHREESLNDFYGALMDFDNGDEVLQVGCASTLAAVRHLYRKQFRRRAQPPADAVRALPAISFDEDADEGPPLFPLAANASVSLPQYPFCGE